MTGTIVGSPAFVAPEAIRGALRTLPCEYPVLASLRPRRLQGQVLDERLLTP